MPLSAMVIDACEPEILERPGPEGFDQPLPGGRRIDFAPGHLFEQIVQLFV